LSPIFSHKISTLAGAVVLYPELYCWNIWFSPRTATRNAIISPPQCRHLAPQTKILAPFLLRNPQSWWRRPSP